jgi:hypothetical protein
MKGKEGKVSAIPFAFANIGRDKTSDQPQRYFAPWITSRFHTTINSRLMKAPVLGFCPTVKKLTTMIVYGLNSRNG